MTIKCYTILTNHNAYSPEVADNLTTLLYQLCHQINNPRWYDNLIEDFWYWFDVNDKAMCEAIMIFTNQIATLLDNINPVFAKVSKCIDTYLLEIYYG